jgi:hypothetical protein
MDIKIIQKVMGKDQINQIRIEYTFNSNMIIINYNQNVQFHILSNSFKSMHFIIYLRKC